MQVFYCSSLFLSLQNVPEQCPNLHLFLLHHHRQLQHSHHPSGQDTFCYNINKQTWILVLSAKEQQAVIGIWNIKLINW